MLMSIINAIYDAGAAMPSNEEAYRKAIQDTELFALSPQLSHLLAASGRLSETPDWFAEQLRENHRQAVNHNVYMKYTEERILRRFEAHGLDVIPLKGIRFAETAYGHFAARITSDVDLFVPKRQLDASIRCLEADGFVFEVVKDHHARLHRNGLMVELHWTLDKQHWSDLRTEPFWRDAAPLGGASYVRELSPEHAFYFIALHGARHQMDSVRYLLDVAQMLHVYGPAIDIGRVMDEAALDKTSRRVQAVLSIVYDQWPVFRQTHPLPFEPIETHWDYETIRNARLGKRGKKYYLYKLFFRHLIFDTLKHQMRSIRKAY